MKSLTDEVPLPDSDDEDKANYDLPDEIILEPLTTDATPRTRRQEQFHEGQKPCLLCLFGQ